VLNSYETIYLGGSESFSLSKVKAARTNMTDVALYPGSAIEQTKYMYMYRSTL